MIKKLPIFFLICALVLSSCSKKEEKTKKSLPLPPDDGKTVIVIDSGHGFEDVGCVFDGGYEKDLNLQLAEKLSSAFEDAGAEVILTHDGEKFPTDSEIRQGAEDYAVMYDPSLLEDNNLFGKYERAIWENILDRKYSVDLFISIHANSIDGHPEICGASIDYCTLNPYAAALAEFSEVLSDALERDDISDSLKIYADTPEEAYVVTRYASCPSVLIEAGYTTNEKELEKMQDEKWQEEFARAVSSSAMKIFTGKTEK